MDKRPKKILYDYVDSLRQCLSIDAKNRDFNVINICREQLGICVKTIPFKTPGLRGMAYPETGDTGRVIILNSRRQRNEQNFDCCHELIHLLRHHPNKAQSFSCYEKIRPNQSPFYEWEANEGAAELVMPYKLIIPDFVNTYHTLVTRQRVECPEVSTMEVLAEKYNVSPLMAQYRIDNLKFELAFYCSGHDINSIVPSSKGEQHKRNIHMEKVRYMDLIDLAFNDCPMEQIEYI